MDVKTVAVVTGASQGIGRSASIRLARDFSAIVLAARNAGRTQRSRECRKECRRGAFGLRP